MKKKEIIMKSVTYLFVIFLLNISFSAVSSPKQETNPQETPQTSGSTLTNQFNHLKEKSNTYEEYKVVKITTLNSFWKNIQDSLSVVKIQLNSSKKEIADQKEELRRLKEEIAKRDQSLASGEFEKAHIKVLGMDVLKENYIYFSWSIIGILLLLLIIGYFGFKSSKNIAHSKGKDLEAISDELHNFRQKAREKELKLGRELQTERNKVEELNQKIVSLKKQVHL